MRIPYALKRSLRRPSTRLRLRQVRSALRDLRTDVSNEARHRDDLRKYCHGKTEILLNIGCGELIQPMWINVDFKPRSGAFYFNALNPLPIDDQSVRRIHAEHFLEHLEYDDAIRFLCECKRILEVGGTMRIIVPDLEKYVRAYANNDTAFFDRLKDLGGAVEPLPTNGAICNQMFRMGGDHRFAWDFETLKFASHLAGLGSIRRSHHNDPSVADCIDGQDWWRPFESLYVEVIR